MREGGDKQSQETKLSYLRDSSKRSNTKKPKEVKINNASKNKNPGS
jgi:hypothetical protein